jgi:hypothetical protein
MDCAGFVLPSEQRAVVTFGAAAWAGTPGGLNGACRPAMLLVWNHHHVDRELRAAKDGRPPSASSST